MWKTGPSAPRGAAVIAGLFRRGGARRRAIEALHEAINAAARRPGLYTRLGVPDTVEGRFEALCLHVILVLRRLGGLPAPAADVAQDLVDSVFAQFDAALRELGVGDLGVAKRMKTLGAAFYGRAAGYAVALDADGGDPGDMDPGDLAALGAVLARNVLGGVEAEDAAGLAAYVRAADAGLGQADLDALLGAGPPFPDPDGFARA